ncbi:unnamed protein product [Knipowitschia caucasica]
MKKLLREYRDFGLEFYVYLEETRRSSLRDRPTLNDIYRNEFRQNRSGFPFSAILYGLSRFGQVRVKHGSTVIFLKKICKLNWSQPTRVDIADKNGIEIFSPDHRFKDGKISFRADRNTEHTVQLYIENTGLETAWLMDHSLLCGVAHFSLGNQHHSLDIAPKSHINIVVKYIPSKRGVETAMLALEFKLRNSFPSFYIVRFIEAECLTTTGAEDTPNLLRSHPSWTPPIKFTIFDGQLPEEFLKEKKQTKKVQLLNYEVEDNINNLILALKNSAIYDQRQTTLQSPLSISNYTEKLRLLLHLEEHQVERDVRKFNIPNDDQQEATMERDQVSELLVLKFTSGNFPVLERGDQLLVSPVGERKNKYRGYVHTVQHESVTLGFGKELLDIFVNSMKFHIEFMVNRLNFRTMHRAIELAMKSGLGPVLFPEAPPSSAPLTLPDLKLFDKKLEKNPEQYRAVQHIVAGSSKPAPYVVFGPPGTGKTVTLVEAIKQIIHCQPHSCILVCAHTNKAVDTLCESLLQDVGPQLLRIYAKSHSPQDVPNNLKNCSNLVGNYFEFPEDIQDLKSVNATTLLTSSRFVTQGFPTGHFTHVFVDEAGYASEATCILPLAGLLHSHTGQVVLAGDHKQLEPIVRSPWARKFGMGLSLLERLMTLYQKTNVIFDNNFVIKLLRNFRSHPAILEIPNKLFYNNELLARADEYERNSCCFFEFLPQKNFPVIFHEVVNKSSGLSCFNTAEVDELMGYVRKLINGKSNVSPEDIGIIAPYWKQVKNISMALKKYPNTGGLKVGTVEQFQGQERSDPGVHSQQPYAEPEVVQYCCKQSQSPADHCWKPDFRTTVGTVH